MLELIVDSFAGGGGASTGIELALRRSPDIAINHDAVALAMHEVNHPATVHLTEDIWAVDPVAVCGRRPVGLLWASPDCKHFSKAKGGKPVEKNIRSLAWVVVHWANTVAPRVIILENVEEFATWGPLNADAKPCPIRKGETFKRWTGELERLGYVVEWCEIRAANHGAPTTRNRLFLIARRDGRPIVWPEDSHAENALGPIKPWRTAAETIDWSLPCPSIFETSAQIKAKHGIRAIRPLADNTMARIARGVKRYVIDAAMPFIVPITHTGDARVYGLDEPARTITTAHRGEQALISPFVTKFNGGATGHSMREPLHTITSAHSETRPGGASPLGLVAAFLAQHNTDMVGHDMREPLSTIVQKGCTQAVVSAGLLNLKGSKRRASGILDPTPTQTAGGWHIAEVRAFLMKYYGSDQDPRLEEPLHTATTKDRFGLVTVDIAGEPYAIVDIGMRMLTPRELFRAQGFSDDYIIDRRPDGAPINKTDQIRLCGNSVCPPVAAALVAANVPELAAESRVAA